MRYKRLNEQYILDTYTGMTLNQDRVIKRLNTLEDLLREEIRKVEL